MKNNYTTKLPDCLLWSILLFMCFGTERVYAQHFDPSPTKTKHSLTFSQHVNTVTTFNAARIPNILTLGSEVLRTCDNATSVDQDVACQVSFVQSGSTSAFGTVSDNLDMITTQSQLDAVHNQPGFVKIVTALLLGGGRQTGIVKDIPSSSLILAQQRSGTSDADYAQTIVHEFGHNQGLKHRGPTPSPLFDYDSIGYPVMGTRAGLLFREINLPECKKYHNGFNIGDDSEKNRPVDLIFVVDDTGSMSEEIEGVKQGIIQFLNAETTAPNSCSAKVYQLITFKDSPNTTRAPTSDLTVIRSQVSALFASGGGDCPEASIESMIAADAFVKDGGEVRLYTDADPHPGQTKESVTALYNKRGVKQSTILSGNCGGSTSALAAAYEKKTGKTFPASNNNDGSNEAESAAVTNSTDSAIDAYSFIAQQTGGTFVFFPEVNSGNPADLERYKNLVFNLLVGTTSSAITLIEPFSGPAGSTLTLNLTGTNTNFNASSVVVFSGSGITVGTPNVISPTKIEVSITISSTVNLGLKDVAVTTTLAGGGIETANGVGLFAVTAATTAPTIVGITPTSGSTGQTLMVTVSGLNTNFTNSSVLNIGSGITVLSSTALSVGQLQAQIKIADDAVVGFRNVIVTTGAEVATENVTGPFLVTTGGCTPITIPSVSIPSGGTATLTASGCAGTLLWSTGATTSSIMVGPLTESTIVSATCTTGPCVVLASASITVLPPTGGGLTLLAPTYNCTTGAFTFNTSGGDGSPITFSAIGITAPTTNPNQFVDTEIRTAADAKPITLHATQNGVTVTYVWDIRAVCPITPVGGGGLALAAPTYNCTTGAFTFNTTGGNGSPIIFSAIGITAPTTNPNQFVDTEIRTAADAKPITLHATQNGVTVTYVWDIRAVCPSTPVVGGGLTLLAPTYNCATGAFTFNTSGGNGSAIEYRAVPGITDWTTNPNQFVDAGSRTASDVKPFMLQARQSGVVVTLVWDLKAACGRARVSAAEPLTGLRVTVLGNPIAGETVEVEVSGVEQQPVHFQLSNFQGQLINEHHIKQAAAVERVQVQLSKSAGVYLLQVSSPNQTKVVRVLKVN